MNTYTRFLIILSLSFFSFSLASSQISFLENGEHSLLASTSGLYGGSTTRKTLDLSGDWEFSLDEKQTWQSVKVPSCYDGIGKIWFRRSFSVSEDVLEQYASSLVCFGVNYFCEITINDNFVGRHIGGSTSFSFLLEKNVLQLGSNNTIVIYVDNELNARNTLPLRHQVRGWRNYGGIYRDIFLLFTPKMFLNDIVVKTKLSPNRENATVNVRATVYNAGFSLQQKNEDGGKRIAPLALIEIIDKDSGVVVAKS
ncbi:MAG: hypothetical protein KGZ58_10905, partial [Ignavibacteriales bacterium]|nr:hypothetical protein [Ignavibacteriales bacterium]